MSKNITYQPACRVQLPVISTWERPGDETVIEHGKIGDLGSKTYISPNNVIYQQPGVTIREFNHRGLNWHQKKEHLGPEFFNTGCATLYGNSLHDHGPNTTVDDKKTQDMFNYYFSSVEAFRGNNPWIGNAGVKHSTMNSANGWHVEKNGELIWEKENKKHDDLNKC